MPLPTALGAYVSDNSQAFPPLAMLAQVKFDAVLVQPAGNEPSGVVNEKPLATPLSVVKFTRTF